MKGLFLHSNTQIIVKSQNKISYFLISTLDDNLFIDFVTSMQHCCAVERLLYRNLIPLAAFTVNYNRYRYLQKLLLLT